MTYFFIASLFNLIFYTLTSFISNLKKITNLILKIISNIHNNQRFTDAYTCYKVIEKKLFSKLNLQKNIYTFYQKAKINILNNIENQEILNSHKSRGNKESEKKRFIDTIIYLVAILKFKFFYNESFKLINQ